MEVLAAIAALAPLAIALLQAWAKGRPRREAAARRAEYDADEARFNRAMVRGDAEGIAQAFEKERLERLRLLPGGRVAAERLHDRPADPGEPAS